MQTSGEQGWAGRVLPPLALGLLALGSYLGLVHAPRERMMGDVYRILFVHVPSAWISLLAYTANLGASVAFLWRDNMNADTLAESTAEVGVLFNALVLVTGSIWGHPTWGTWWTWDPRLTSAAVMLFTYAGYLALRRLVDDPQKRAAWSSVVAIMAYISIPITWFSVRWWNSLHQIQSSPSTVAPPMVLALRVNAFAFLFIMIWFVRKRYTIGLREQAWQTDEPPVRPKEI